MRHSNGLDAGKIADLADDAVRQLDNLLILGELGRWRPEPQRCQVFGPQPDVRMCQLVEASSKETRPDKENRGGAEFNNYEVSS